MRVLYLEDYVELSKVVSKFLSQYAIVDCVSTIEEAKDFINNYKYDFLLLDRTIGNEDVGLTLIEFAKNINPDAYIIIMSAFGESEDKIKGLELGANDYLKKPFDIKELYARMMTLQRQNASIKLDIQGLICDTNEKRIFYNNDEVMLTQKENELLFYLIMNRQKIISNEQLLHTLYMHPEEVTANTILVTITNIRKKLPVNIIKTIKTRGYTIDS